MQKIYLLIVEGKRQLVVYFTPVIFFNRDTYGIKALSLSLQQVILKTYVLHLCTNHLCTMTRLLEDTEDEVNFHVLIFQHLMICIHLRYIEMMIFIFLMMSILQLAELIKKGSVKVGGVSKVLCQDLSKHCSQTR